MCDRPLTLKVSGPTEAVEGRKTGRGMLMRDSAICWGSFVAQEEEREGWKAHSLAGCCFLHTHRPQHSDSEGRLSERASRLRDYIMNILSIGSSMDETYPKWRGRTCSSLFPSMASSPSPPFVRRETPSTPLD